MRKCSKCNETKDWSEFHNDRTMPGGKAYKCKKCSSIDSKKRRETEPEKYKEKQRRNLEKNYDSIKESQRKHVEKNKDKILERRRKRYEQNREKILKKENERRKTPSFREYARKYQQKLRDERKELISAWSTVNKAISSGKIIKGSKCETCGSLRRIEAHHADYGKPLEVQWLCKKCHINIHKSDL